MKVTSNSCSQLQMVSHDNIFSVLNTCPAHQSVTASFWLLSISLTLAVSQRRACLPSALVLIVSDAESGVSGVRLLSPSVAGVAALLGSMDREGEGSSGSDTLNWSTSLILQYSKIDPLGALYISRRAALSNDQQN